jgi:hypothetical protein
MRAGWALLDLARGTRRPDWDDKAAMADYERTVLPIARKAMEFLFAAAEAGAVDAYQPLGILSMLFGERLGNDALAVRLRDKSHWEWIEEGAAHGSWEGQCKVAKERIHHLRWDGRTYSRDEFDTAVGLARRCIDRKAEAVPTWYDGPEWLMAAPRRTPPAPTLVISETQADLNALLFHDADRRLGGEFAAPTRTPGITVAPAAPVGGSR